MSSRGRFVFKDGKFVEGKATPWLPPEHMRGLPGSFVTRDEAESDKIHELDPPHIVQGIIYDQKKALEAEKKDMPAALEKFSQSVAPLGARVPLNQNRIDVVRFRVIRARITRLFASPDQQKALADLRVDYLFFPEDNVNKYELRSKAQLPAKLPKHLRNFKLEIDIYNWPQSVVDALTSIGQKPPNIREMINDARRKAEIAEELQREESVLWTPGGDH